jgi:hypothetical protein
VDGACSTHGKDEECIYEYSREAEGRVSLGRAKPRWEDNIDMNLKAVEVEDVEWTLLAQDIV